MTVRGPNSLKPLLNSNAESSADFQSQVLSKKSQQNGSLQSKKTSNQKSNIVESNVSAIMYYKYFLSLLVIYLPRKLVSHFVTIKNTYFWVHKKLASELTYIYIVIMLLVLGNPEFWKKELRNI